MVFIQKIIADRHVKGKTVATTINSTATIAIIVLVSADVVVVKPLIAFKLNGWK
jgi:hypothetical protein